MAYRVLSINKEGNKIIDYTCDYNGKEVRLNKERLIQEINSKCVENAKIQNYKGQIIIRVDIDGAEKKTRKPRQANSNVKHNDKVKYEYETSYDSLLSQMFDEYKLVGYDKYKSVYFKAHPEQLDKSIKSTDYRNKLNTLIEMSNFCELVRNREYSITKDKLTKSFDTLEYKAYCQENNIDFEETE